MMDIFNKILNMSFAWTVGIFIWVLNFVRYFFHKPLKTIKYWRHNIIEKNILSNKTIRIELVNKENFGLNKKVAITDIKFAISGIDYRNKEFSATYKIDWIDKKYLTFKENDDIQEYTLKIPYKICFDYHNAKELYLSIGYKTPLDSEFKFSFNQINLKAEIIEPFNNFTKRQIELIDYNQQLDNETKEILKKKINPDHNKRETDDFELGDDQYELRDDGKWYDKNGNELIE